MLLRTYRLAPGCTLWQHAGRHWVLGLHPLQQFELNATAAQVLRTLSAQDAEEPGVPLHELIAPVTPAVLDFLEEKVAQGLLRATYAATPPTAYPEVEVIVPAYGRAAALQECLVGSAAQDYPLERVRVSVVDDASPQPLRDQVRVPAGLEGRLRWLRLERNAGAASARNVALGTAWPAAGPAAGVVSASMQPMVADGAPLVALVDADCLPDPAWLATLVSAMEDATLAGVGGRVAGRSHACLLARYEDACSSLHLGGAGGPAGGPEHRYPYLPTCNLLLRRSALRRAGGFTPGLRLAEDVDLCWRLHDLGERLLYLPLGCVRHDYRASLGPFLRRKAQYAASEGWLRRQHPGRFQRNPPREFVLLWCAWGVASLWSAGAGLLTALLLGAAGAVLRRLRLRLQVPVPLALQLRALLRRQAAGVLQQARSWLRGGLLWMLLGVPLLAWWPRLGIWLAALWALGVLGEWLAKRPALPPWEFAWGLSWDALASSAGKAWGLLGPPRRRLARSERVLAAGRADAARPADQEPAVR